jgi:hypothetical protein
MQKNQKTKMKQKTVTKARVVSNAKQSRFEAIFGSRFTKVYVVVLFVVIGLSTLVWARAATTTSTLWSSGTIPKVISDNDTQSVELGVKFKAKYAGQVLGVKFYKGPLNTGTHTGSLWTSGGRLLANVTFTNEKASGWQTAMFTNPVNITAGTTYIVSYHSPNGHYSADNNYFTQAYTNSDSTLTAPKNAGVYKYGKASALPTSTYQASNYWVDVLFSRSTFFPTEKPAAPTGLQGTATDTGISLAWTASTTAGVTQYVVTRGGSTVATLSGSATGYLDTAVTAGQSYTYSVKAVDQNAVASDPSNSATVTMPSAPEPVPPAPVPMPAPDPVPSTDFPGPTNTGYKNAPGYPGQLTKFTGSLQSGQTYKYYEFDPGLEVGNVSDVTFYGCRFDGLNSAAFANVIVRGGQNITFDYSSFIPQKLATPPAAYGDSSQFGIWVYPANIGKLTVDHSDFWAFGNGIQFFPSGDSTKPFTVRNSWIHDARADGGTDHTDGILNGDTVGSYITIDHNTIVSKGNTNGLALQDTADRNVSVTNNYFSGFGYTVRLGGSGNQNFTFTGNTYGTDIKPEWGPLYGWTSGSGNLWRDNKWHVAPGGYSTKTTDDGKYWWPDGTLSTSDYSK